MSFTGSGNKVGGTAALRLRRTYASDCSDVLGFVETRTLSNGRVESNSISFDLGPQATYRFSGTFTSTHESVFDSGNLTRSYHSINTDIQKRIRYPQAPVEIEDLATRRKAGP